MSMIFGTDFFVRFLFFAVVILTVWSRATNDESAIVFSSNEDEGMLGPIMMAGSDADLA